MCPGYLLQHEKIYLHVTLNPPFNVTFLKIKFWKTVKPAQHAKLLAVHHTINNTILGNTKKTFVWSPFRREPRKATVPSPD